MSERDTIAALLHDEQHVSFCGSDPGACIGPPFYRPVADRLIAAGVRLAPAIEQARQHDADCDGSPCECGAEGFGEWADRLAPADTGPQIVSVEGSQVVVRADTGLPPHRDIDMWREGQS